MADIKIADIEESFHCLPKLFEKLRTIREGSRSADEGRRVEVEALQPDIWRRLYYTTLGGWVTIELHSGKVPRSWRTQVTGVYPMISESTVHIEFALRDRRTIQVVHDLRERATIACINVKLPKSKVGAAWARLAWHDEARVVR